MAVVARVAEQADDPRGDENEQRRQRGQPEQDDPEKAGCNPPRPLAIAAFLQFGEDRHERRRQRRVRDEGACEVRHLERDRERVDLPGRAEVIRGDDLADETEDAGDPGGEREDRRRPGEPAAGALIHAAEYREGTLWYHPAARELRAFSRDAEHPPTEEARPHGREAAAREPALSLDRENAGEAARGRREGRRPEPRRRRPPRARPLARPCRRPWGAAPQHGSAPQSPGRAARRRAALKPESSAFGLQG